MLGPLITYVGSVGVITDSLQRGNPPKPYTLPKEAVLQLHARRIDSSEEIVLTGKGSVINADAGTVQFEPSKEDFNAAEILKAWWRVVTEGQLIDFPEWDLIVGQHAQGLTVLMGVIARRAAAMLPTTWQKLREVSYVGDWELQNKVEINKYRFLAPTIYRDAEHEYELNPLVIDWLAKRTVLDVIPAGIDYWMNIRTSATTPQEHASYGERLQSLRSLQQTLSGELQGSYDEFQSIYGPFTRLTTLSPKSDTERLPHVTADPVGMPIGWGLTQPRVLTPDYREGSLPTPIGNL